MGTPQEASSTRACSHKSSILDTACSMSASLIGRMGSSAFRLSTTAMSMSLAGSCFSSESAPGPFHHGIRRRGGTISSAALLSVEQQDQADMRTHLIHRPARDIFPLLGGSRAPPIALILCAPHAAAVSLVQRNSVPSTHMRCIITASRRQGHDRLFHPAAPGDLHGPGLEP
jgi:hypothetical protein